VSTTGGNRRRMATLLTGGAKAVEMGSDTTGA
jgi:hypothetical protein